MLDGLTLEVGLSLMPTADFRRAALPLLAAGEVDVLEWSVDVRYHGGTPQWCRVLLDHFHERGRLLGHGVHLSMLSAGSTVRQERWLESLSVEREHRRYQHFSEHFGFMTAGRFDRGAPLPVPYCRGALSIGRRRLRRLADVIQCPVGLENLALAWSAADVWSQGAFVAALLEPVDGFVVLDLHNLWCGAINYDLDPIRVLESWPLERVRELHVSGGSWSTHASGRFRRDTHDDAVPPQLDDLLVAAIERCPMLTHVIVERMGGTLRGPEDEAQFVGDYRRVRALAKATAGTPRVATPRPELVPLDADEQTVGRLQLALLEGFAARACRDELVGSVPAVFAPWVETFDPRAIEVGHALSTKWSRTDDARQ